MVGEGVAGCEQVKRQAVQLAADERRVGAVHKQESVLRGYVAERGDVGRRQGGAVRTERSAGIDANGAAPGQYLRAELHGQVGCCRVAAERTGLGVVAVGLHHPRRRDKPFFAGVVEGRTGGAVESRRDAAATESHGLVGEVVRKGIARDRRDGGVGVTRFHCLERVETEAGEDVSARLHRRSDDGVELVTVEGEALGRSAQRLAALLHLPFDTDIPPAAEDGGKFGGGGNMFAALLEREGRRLGESHIVDVARARRCALDILVVHDDELVIAREADVCFEAAYASVEALSEAPGGIVVVFGTTAAMAVDERAFGVFPERGGLTAGQKRGKCKQVHGEIRFHVIKEYTLFVVRLSILLQATPLSRRIGIRVARHVD